MQLFICHFKLPLLNINRLNVVKGLKRPIFFCIDCNGLDPEVTQKSRIGLPQLETTFDTIVEAFVFFDRDKDGYVSKDELVGAINEISPGKQGARIGMQRFGELLTNA